MNSLSVVTCTAKTLGILRLEPERRRGFSSHAFRATGVAACTCNPSDSARLRQKGHHRVKICPLVKNKNKTLIQRLNENFKFRNSKL